MRLTVRQWAIVAALAAGFIVAAIVVADGGSAPVDDATVDFDEVAWCRTAGAISAWGGVLDGSADDADDVTNLLTALQDARFRAPLDLQVDVARLADLVMLTRQELDTSTVADALERAKEQTDQPRVEQAVTAVSDALVDCGHPPLS